MNPYTNARSQSQAYLFEVMLHLSSPDKETIQFKSFSAYWLRLAICAQQYAKPNASICVSVCCSQAHKNSKHFTSELLDCQQMIHGSNGNGISLWNCALGCCYFRWNLVCDRKASWKSGLFIKIYTDLSYQHHPMTFSLAYLMFCAWFWAVRFYFLLLWFIIRCWIKLNRLIFTTIFTQPNGVKWFGSDMIAMGSSLVSSVWNSLIGIILISVVWWKIVQLHS